MRIAIITLGSYGDVHPYIALGVGLQASGHKVRLLTHETYEQSIRERGLDFHPVGGNPLDILTSDLGKEMVGTGTNPVAFMRTLARTGNELMEHLFVGCWTGSQGVDAIIFSVSGLFAAGYHVAEKLGVPCYAAFLQPANPTRSFPDAIFPPLPSWLSAGRGAYNVLAHHLAAQLAWQLCRQPINDKRRTVLDLPELPLFGPFNRLRNNPHPVLYGYSPTVLPKPPDWPPWVHVTGYWFLDAPPNWEPQPGLIDFLESGPPPVYIGFGSMSDRDPERTTRLLVTALGRARQRGILLGGWAGLSNADLPDYVYHVERVPHDWLFPRVAAVVHHGGLGTTMAGLRAGVPSVIVPFFVDQPFWARRVYELGAGPRPIPRKQLSSDNLSEAITIATSDPLMKRRATWLAKRIRAERGVECAVDLFNHYSSKVELVK
jgi:UDP:flavonoid glycosyltransferase YjiC (YdhE family)